MFGYSNYNYSKYMCMLWKLFFFYSLLCIVVNPNHFNNHDVSPQPPPVCSIHLDDATAAKGQRHQCAHHTPATGGDERERVIETIKCMRSPHTSYRWRGERVIETIKCMRSPHTSYRWRGERDIETIKCMRSPHTSYRWRGESHRDNQVYALTTHQLQVERRESHRANQVYALTTHQLQVERRES